MRARRERERAAVKAMKEREDAERARERYEEAERLKEGLAQRELNRQMEAEKLWDARERDKDERM